MRLGCGRVARGRQRPPRSVRTPVRAGGVTGEGEALTEAERYAAEANLCVDALVGALEDAEDAGGGMQSPVALGRAWLAFDPSMRTDLVVATTPEGHFRVGVVEDGVLVEVMACRRRGSSAAMRNMRVGDVAIANVARHAPTMDACFVNFGLGTTRADTSVTGLLGTRRTRRNLARPHARNDELRALQGVPEELPPLAVGTPVIVMVERAAVGTKGPRVTDHISLAGRYAVLIPQSDRERVRVSRKLREDERERLRELGERLCPEGASLIIRTEAAAADDLDIEADVQSLVKRWSGIWKRACQMCEQAACKDGSWRPLKSTRRRSKSPVLYAEDALHCVLRDHFSNRISSLVVDTEATLDYVAAQLTKMGVDVDRVCEDGRLVLFSTSRERALRPHVMRELAARPENAEAWTPRALAVAQRLAAHPKADGDEQAYAALLMNPLVLAAAAFKSKRRKRPKGKDEIFQRLCLDGDLYAGARVPLDPLSDGEGGAHLVIEHTEALTTIDVNAGRTALTSASVSDVNVAAAAAVAHQLRLRDLAGLIVVDFINEDLQGYSKVEAAMEEALSRDRADVRFLPVSAFGLMQISRSRLKTYTEDM